MNNDPTDGVMSRNDFSFSNYLFDVNSSCSGFSPFRGPGRRKGKGAEKKRESSLKGILQESGGAP